MVQRIQKTKSKGDFERDETMASETLDGERPNQSSISKARRNVAPEAHDEEPEDFDEQNQAFVAGDTAWEKSQPGTYDDDYGPGTGVRGADLEKPADEEPVLERKPGSTEADAQDFPTGGWSRQKAKAKLPAPRKAPKARSRTSTSGRTTKPRTAKTGAKKAKARTTRPTPGRTLGGRKGVGRTGAGGNARTTMRAGRKGARQTTRAKNRGTTGRRARR